MRSEYVMFSFRIQRRRATSRPRHSRVWWTFVGILSDLFGRPSQSVFHAAVIVGLPSRMLTIGRVVALRTCVYSVFL